ncbi:helix-turn-helix domain-containing protein [Halobaculum sp. MBLA0147]|uniref:helix-turn-helix domain-containing protein n=1 Tax=Halobaculum sp. MBLA0147 TaxID=3079934 RepID=UPI003525D226
MPASMTEYLGGEIDCERLLDCFHGLKDLDRRVYDVLAESDTAMTVDDIADVVDRERSTAYRSVKRLVDAGVVEREQINYDEGGYYHVFEPRPTDEVADEMQATLNEFYAEMGTLIGEFRDEYDDAARVSLPAES